MERMQSSDWEGRKRDRKNSKRVSKRGRQVLVEAKVRMIVAKLETLSNDSNGNITMRMMIMGASLYSKYQKVKRRGRK